MVLVFAWSVKIAMTQARMKYWPKTTAKVIEFDSGEVPSPEGYSWYANPRIRYSYEVDGDKFESQRLNPSPLNYQSQHQLKSDTEGFDNGSEVRCWYNPSKPDVSYVVNRGVTPDIWIISALSGLFMLNAVRVFFARANSAKPKSKI